MTSIKAKDIKETISLLIKKGYPGFNLKTEDLKGEVWKDVSSYKGLYQVSNLGRIKSFAINNSKKRRINGVILKQQLQIPPSKMPRFIIDFKKFKESFATDTVVGISFLGKKKANETYAHINKDKLDNRSENLKIVSKTTYRKLNYNYLFIRLSDNKKLLKSELAKEYNKPVKTVIDSITQSLRKGKMCYGSFWKKEYLPELNNLLSLSNIWRNRNSKHLKKQMDSLYIQRHVFTKNKANKRKKHSSVISFKIQLERRKIKLTESELKNYAGFNTQLGDLRGEEWEDILGYDGVYRISNFGRVKSCSRYLPDGRYLKEKIRKQNLEIKNKVRRGFSILLHQDNNARQFQVSMLVGMAFIREKKTNEVYSHFNKDPLDNRSENIKVITRNESRKLDFIRNVRLDAKYEYIRSADGKRFLHRDITKEYDSEYASSEINRGIKSKKKRYGSFWERRILKIS